MKTIVNIATQFREGVLGDNPSNWMCRAVCLPLLPYLNLSGYQFELTEGVILSDEESEIYHTWLTRNTRDILDPTADQMNDWKNGARMPPVYYGPKPDWYLTI